MLSLPHFLHVNVYPAHSWMVFKHCLFFPLPLSQTGQPCFLQLSVSIGEVLVANFLSGTPSCSTIFGLTKPLFCSLISSAICSHDDASVPFGVGGQKMGMRLVGFFFFFLCKPGFFFLFFKLFRFQVSNKRLLQCMPINAVLTGH